jgi:hypothetical protein
MRTALASSSTPSLVLGAVLVSALIVWLSRPDDPAGTGQPVPATPRTAELHKVDRSPLLRGQERPEQGGEFNTQARQVFDLLEGWLRDNYEAVKSPEPLGTEAESTSG